MPAYAYPIQIKRKRQTIRFEEKVKLTEDWLTLPTLAFVGNDTFSICETEHDSGTGTYTSGYTVTVNRQRPETDDEMNTRIASEESYMREYERRKALRQPRP